MKQCLICGSKEHNTHNCPRWNEQFRPKVYRYAKHP